MIAFIDLIFLVMLILDAIILSPKLKAIKLELIVDGSFGLLILILLGLNPVMDLVQIQRIKSLVLNTIHW